MTRARTKKAKEVLTQLVAKVLEFKPTLGSMEGKLTVCIKPLDEGWLMPILFSCFCYVAIKSVRDQF